MIIAVASEWGENFDRYAFYRVENAKIKEEQVIPVPPGGVAALAEQLVGLEVDLLIAPPMSEEVENALREAGVKVLSGVVGKAGMVAKAYLTGTLQW